MRITPQSVESSSIGQQSSKAQSTHESFIDTLTKASNVEVQKTGCARSEARQNSQGHLNNSASTSVRSSKSSSVQTRESASRSNRSESVVKNQLQTDSKLSEGAGEASVDAEKSTIDKVERASDKSASKKTALTSHVASQVALQGSTVQAEIDGRIIVPARTVDTNSQTPSGESAEQPVGIQSGSAITGQGLDIQGLPGVTGPIVFADAQNLQAGLRNDGPQVSDALKADGTSAGQVEMHVVGVVQMPDLKASASDDAKSSTVNAAGDASVVPSFDVVGMTQANVAAKNQTEFSVRPGDGRGTLSTVKGTQSKQSGATAGLNSGGGDSAKPAKNDETGDDHSSAHVVGVASIQTLSNQTGTAHGAPADAKSGEIIAFQPTVIAVQAESRATTGSHALSNSPDSSGYQGSGSEGVTWEQGTGNLPASMSGISTARLIQTIGASEMRVGMHSAEFGDISIRTSVAQLQMQTQISVDHGELGSALASHIPNLQAKLGNEYGLHSTIEVNQGGASFSSDSDRSQQQQQQTVERRSQIIDGPVVLRSDVMSLAASAITSSSSRLDIRA